ncbi:MAG: hypothetical protein ABSA58_13740 [Acetobacteraceae bacterium]|jgi:hypothetical protein
MSNDLPSVPGASPLEPLDDARQPGLNPDPGSGLFGQSQDCGPIDWADAVDAAAARLIETWVNPDTTDHIVASGLADEFAATLCAYGMAPAEVAHHMQDHMDEMGIGQRWEPEDSHITPMGAPHTHVAAE